MAGSDEEGFKPHPGDPWHPGWSGDAEPDEVGEATAPSEEVETPVKPKKRRGRRRLRGGDEKPEDQADEPLAGVVDGVGTAETDAFPPASSPVGPAGSLSEQDEAVGPPDVEVEEEEAKPDPFEAVLEREGLARRGQEAAAEDAPQPAWTIEGEPGADQVLPVDQPSWIGHTTEADPGIEAIGFEPEMAEEPAEHPAEAQPLDGAVGEADVDQPGLLGSDEVGEDLGGEGVTEGDVEIAVAAEAEESPAASEEKDEQRAIVGEYGVAGPEAFDVLQGPDLVDDAEREEWDAFVEGAAPPEVPEAPVGVPEDLDEWVDAEPKKKRRGFLGRRKRRAAEEIIDDGFVGAATEPEGGETGPGDGAEAAPPTALEEPAVVGEHGADDPALAEILHSPFDDSPEPAAKKKRRGFLGRKRRAAEEIIDDGFVGAATEPEGGETGPGDGAEAAPPTALEEPAFTLPTEDLDSAPSAVEDHAPFMPPDDAVPVPVDVEDETVEAATAEVEADPGRVPGGWFADIDEDTVEPPSAAETPETERPVESEGPWEGRTAERAEPADVFDVEHPDEVEFDVGVSAPELLVPEGYEPWDEAVADAVGRGEPVTEPSAEPVTATSPEGFEPFPGIELPEEFDISEEAMRAEMVDDELWIADPADAADTATHEMDTPYLPGGALEEQMYAAGGTVEHRDLAEAIAQAGDENTQWQALSAAMPGLETGVVGFEDVADLGGALGADDHYVAPVRSNLGVRIVTGVVLVGLLFGSLLWHEAAFSAFVGIIAMLGLTEFYGTLRRRGFLPLSLFGFLGGVGILVATWYHGALAIPTGLLLTSMITFFFYAFAPIRRDALTEGGLTILGLAWVVGTAAFAIPIARAEFHQELVFAIVAVTAAMDMGAYSVGRAWGRSQLAPVLSPNKTVEGLAGGVVLAMGVAAAIGFFELGPFDLRAGIALGLVVMVIAPIGDLAESLVKRSLGVKDMGSTLPGHGGILDRIDALLFVIPAAWVLYETIGYLG
ncbi:MAG: phosphatidate cytidylyltransferase [Acidimicrobiia bacterium]